MVTKVFVLHRTSAVLVEHVARVASRSRSCPWVWPAIMPATYTLTRDSPLMDGSHYPPPPQPDQQHYNPIYQTAAGAQHLLDPGNNDQLDFGQLSQPSTYPKVEGDQGLDSNTSSQIEQRIEQLQHQQPLPPHLEQQDPVPIHQEDVLQPHQPDGQTQQNATNKANRLRKACDSCSIRKVKVCLLHVNIH